MSSSKHDSAPLNRWKSRFWVFTKPMFWISSFVLMLTGLLIADYYRVSISSEELEETSVSDFDAEASEIPLSNDPELQELRGWEIAEEETSDTSIGIGLGAADPEADAIAPEPAGATDTDGAGLLSGSGSNGETDGEGGDFWWNNLEDSPEADAEDAGTNDPDAQPRRDRQDERDASLFSDYISRADDVLDRMGLTPPAASPGNLLSLPDGPELFSSSPAPTNLGLGATPTTSPSSSLHEAIQNLSSESSTRLTTDAAGLEVTEGTPLEQSIEALTPNVLPSPQTSTADDALDPAIAPLLEIQTAPLPGTTGYTPPPTVAQFSTPTPLSGSTISVPSIPSAAVPVPPTGNVPTNLLPSTAAAPTQAPIQPTFSAPGQTSSTVPSPVFPPTMPPEPHVPYSGGGRNGQINTFANP